MPDAGILAIILARAGSKLLPGKNTRLIGGRPTIAWTIEEALRSSMIDATCLTTDSPEALEVGRAAGIFVVERPTELATDTATVDSAARHAVIEYERVYPPVTHVAILYGNVPVRAPAIIDQALQHLIATGADSVRSMSRVDKQHPDWLHHLDGDRMSQFRKNSIYRRQDLEPLYYHDGAVVAVTRRSLFTTSDEDAHAFFGSDRRGVVSEGGLTVDIDSWEDFVIADAILFRRQQEHAPGANAVKFQVSSS